VRRSRRMLGVSLEDRSSPRCAGTAPRHRGSACSHRSREIAD
jgi:hypothetical protein